MKRLRRLINENSGEIVFLLAINLVILLINIFSSCAYYSKFANFDLQALLAWDFAAKENLIPYKDIYYPYGLLTYYKNSNIFATILYFAIPHISFTTSYLILKKFFKEKIYIYVFFLVLLSFTIFVSGIDIFYRFGISISLTLFYSYVFYSREYSKRNVLFYLGFVTFLVFWLVHDQGFYCLTVFLVLFSLSSLNDLAHSNKKKIMAKKIFINLFYFFAGSLLGSSLFVLYLLKNNALEGFLSYIFISTPEFPLLSKTPFFTSFFSFNNLFSTTVLSCSILLLAYKAVTKRQLHLSTCIEVGLVILILLFEQKNIIRSMQYPVALVSLFLLAVTLFDFLVIFRLNKHLKQKVYVLCLLSIALLFLLFNRKEFVLICQTKFQDEISSSGDYFKVIRKLKEYKNFDNKIFSFPGEPIFYVILDQKPPFYPSIYEATSEKSQKDLEEFIKRDIRYVVVNMVNRSIQDDVPNYVRGKYLLKFILSNYEVKDSIGSYLILEKKTNSDFFSRTRPKSVLSFQDHLLRIDLQSIPFSEGLYKSKRMLNGISKAVDQNMDQEKINAYLANYSLSSENIVLLAKNMSHERESSIRIVSSNGFATVINFKSCVQHYCVINLNSAPLFYQNRAIEKIELQDDTIVTVLKVPEYIDILW